MNEVQSEIPRIISDPNLPESTRKNLDKLLNTYTEMQGYINNPRNADTFVSKTRELASDFEQQAQALKKLTGVEDFD